MSKHPSFNEVLKKVMADGGFGLLLDEPGFARWNKKLRDFVERWLANRDDSKLWEGIADNAEKDGLSRETSYYRIAVSSLQASCAGDPANVENFSPKALRSQSERFLTLAECAQLMAQHYRGRLRVFGQSDQRSEARAQFYEEEAREFRQASAEALEWASMTRRQSGGVRFTGEQIAFIRSLVENLRRHFGKPYHEAAAAITNIAYPEETVTADEIRTVCRRVPPMERIPARYLEPLYEAMGKTLLEALETATEEDR
jgi:hypothetical protein